jgi:hypothetical protein
MQPIGIRNNNPLNIRVGKDKWKGQVLPQRAIAESEQLVTEGKVGKSGEGAVFCQFQSMEYGIRAAFCLLRTYARKYRLYSVRDIITRWAPPSENDTASYIRHVCMMTGFGGNQRLTEKDWPRLVKAMARMECGVELEDDVIQKARRSLTPNPSPKREGN